MKTKTFHLYNLTPELFVEALMEKGYYFNEVFDIKICFHSKHEKMTIYANGKFGKVKAIAEPENNCHIKITVCDNENNLKKILEFYDELLSLLRLNKSDKKRFEAKLLTQY